MEIIVREKSQGPSLNIKKNGETIIDTTVVAAPAAAPVPEIKKVG